MVGPWLLRFWRLGEKLGHVETGTEFTLVDAGEPDRNDMAAFLIYETSNPASVVLDVPLQILDRGNLQAHFDQPHR